jgi:hypothetical protein
LKKRAAFIFRVQNSCILKIHAAGSSKTSENTYKNTRCHIPEEDNLHSRRPLKKNLELFVMNELSKSLSVLCATLIDFLSKKNIISNLCNAVTSVRFINYVRCMFMHEEWNEMLLRMQTLSTRRFSRVFCSHLTNLLICGRLKTLLLVHDGAAGNSRSCFC